MPRQDFLLAFLVVAIWGASFTVVKIGLEELPPFLFSALRFMLIGALVLFMPRPRGVPFLAIVAIGFLLGVVKFGLVFFAMKTEVSAGSAALLLQTQVFFTLGLGFLIFKEHLTRQQLLGVFTAFFGLAVFVSVRDGAASPFGVVMVLMAALTWAVINIMMKRLKLENPLPLIIWASLVPVLPLFAISYVTETSEPLLLINSLSLNSWLSILYMGALSTVAAYAIWGRLLARHPAIKVTPYALLIPLIAIGVSSVTLGERLAPQEIAGMAAILAGLALCMLPRRLIKARLPALREPTKHPCV